MGQDFTENFNPDDEVLDTMGTQVFVNDNTLRSNFSGVVSPASPIAFQWWSDTVNDKLKIRDETNTSWLDIYDFTIEAVVIGDGAVVTDSISDGARKGSIVQGEDIAPASCTLKPDVIPLHSLPILDIQQGPRSSTVPNWYSLYTTKMYIPQNSGLLYLIARMQDGRARYTIGGINSGETANMGGTPTWTGEVSANLTSLFGWHDVSIQVRPSGVTAAYLSGLSMRWEG